MVLGRIGLGQLIMRIHRRDEIPTHSSKDSQAGSTLIELMIASLILVIVSLGILPLLAMAIATNGRNRVDSTGTMLANAIIEQIKSTRIGSETASLTDCGGTNWAINTALGGSNVSGAGIDFTQTSPPANYHMNYVVSSPCNAGGQEPVTYDVRWRVDLVGNTYLITVGVRQGQHQSLLFSQPYSLRVMVGN